MRKTHIVAMIAAVTAAGCAGTDRDEDGPAASRDFAIGDFREIEVAGPYDVEVRTGAAASASAKGSEKLLDRTRVEVRGDRLIIQPAKQNGWFARSVSGHATFLVTVPQLSGASTAGSGNIKVDRIQAQRFEGSVAGSGGLDLGSVEAAEVELSIAGSGGVRAAGGTARKARYDIAGSGDIDAAGVQAEEASVSIAGSGDVKANASRTADVSIVGSGDVALTGGGKCSVSKTGSGSVTCS